MMCKISKKDLYCNKSQHIRFWFVSFYQAKMDHASLCKYSGLPEPLLPYKNKDVDEDLYQNIYL